MEWNELLKQIIEICIIPLLGVLTTFIVKYLKKKTDELIKKTDNDLAEKYLNMLRETITSCVISTNQTYVETLKATGAFTKESQIKAFQETYNNVMNILSEDCINYLSLTFGDLEKYITNKIETEVNQNKLLQTTE